MRKFFSFWILSFLLVSSAASAEIQKLKLEKPYDHSLWNQFLQKYVNDRGQVDYAAVKKDPSLLNQYLEQITKEKPLETREWPREEQLAFWLNAYHAVLIKGILEHYPVKTVQEIPGFWMQELVQFGVSGLSLNEIHDRKLLGLFRDEKIHLALGCSGKSCPPFPREAFKGPEVEGQLYRMTRKIVNDPAFVQITPGEKKIYLSQIFKWYATDFKLDFGQPENERNMDPEQFAVLSFIAHYLDDLDKVTYLEEGNYKVKYMKFDWHLNDTSSPPAA